MAYIYNKRQIDSSDKQVLKLLQKIAVDEAIVWYERDFGNYYLRRNVYWGEYLKVFLSPEFDLKIGKYNIGALVIEKRSLYKFRGIHYDCGITYSLLEKFKNSSNCKLVLENTKYYVFKPDKQDNQRRIN